MYPEKNGYRISTDPSELDLGAVHGYLKESYWAAGCPRDDGGASPRSQRAP